mmetsp:Transcript_23733/g.46137  ORF Transcript_23733/g.46137 Transcript_23733/m.46137 type:complete len:124 (+) Transcript_23733:694-1065(+)
MHSFVSGLWSEVVGTFCHYSPNRAFGGFRGRGKWRHHSESSNTLEDGIADAKWNSNGLHILLAVLFYPALVFARQGKLFFGPIFHTSVKLLPQEAEPSLATLVRCWDLLVGPYQKADFSDHAL